MQTSNYPGNAGQVEGSLGWKTERLGCKNAVGSLLPLFLFVSCDHGRL